MNISIFFNLITLTTVFIVLYLFYKVSNKKDKVDKNVFEKGDIVVLPFLETDEVIVDTYDIKKNGVERMGQYDYMF
jgi:hypothetical protein|tara:strand:+ start:51 stop:278 length:228 start_codon:yes stop_codon:yes gene_type:complete